MDRTLVISKATNHGQATLSQSCNEMLIDNRELRELKVSSLTSLSRLAKDKCASLPDIALPKISSDKRGDDSSLPGHATSSLPRLNPIPNQIGQGRKTKSSLTRPQSYTARVRPASASPRTPELVARNRKPRPSLPTAVEIGKIRSAPASPILSKTPPCVSKASSFISPRSVVDETELLADFRRRSYDAGLGSSCSTPPLSPALLRKFEDSDKTARKAKKLIDDYKRSTPIPRNTARVGGKSLAEALEEVKNCRYLRVVNRK